MPIANSEALCSADTVINSTSPIDVTGVSLSLGAGTWLVSATASFDTVSTDTYYFKIYNATDAIDYVASIKSLTGGYAIGVTLHKLVTLAGTKTIRLAARKGGTNFTVRRYADGTIPGTYIEAVQVA